MKYQAVIKTVSRFRGSWNTAHDGLAECEEQMGEQQRVRKAHTKAISRTTLAVHAFASGGRPTAMPAGSLYRWR